MRGMQLRKLVVIVAVLSVSMIAQATDYDYTGYDPGAPLEGVFGTKIAELNARDYGYSFGGFNDNHRNFNLISQVFVATQAVTIGTGVGGQQIQLSPGDYTFAYTLDYSQQFGGLVQSPVNDFQLFRKVDDQYIDFVSNPGPNIALESIQAGGYNTGVGFTGTTDPIDGISSISTVFPGFETGEVQFSWPNDGQADPNTMAMVFLFCSDVQVWQMGWGSENGGSLATMAERFAIGDTYEGGNIFGAGGEASYIPVLIPVIPEPTSSLILLLGMSPLLKWRRKTAAPTPQ